MKCLKKKTDSENALTTTFTVAFLSGNFAMRIDRLEVHVAAAPTPFKYAFLKHHFLILQDIIQRKC